MGIDEYLELLQNQIRDKQAKQFVLDEIRGHIEEQVEENMLNGMDEEKAILEAVKDMGDPVSVGVDMDKIHRPHIDWKLVIMIAIISLFNLFVQYCISIKIGSTGELKRYLVLPTITGIVGMILAYRLDYTFFLGKSRVIGIVFLITTVLLSILYGNARGIISFGFGINYRSISLNAVAWLYLPVFGGILYEHKGEKETAVLKILLWTYVPMIFFASFRVITFPYLILLYVAEMVLLMFVMAKDWYRISTKKKLLALLVNPLLFALGFIVWFDLFGKYQEIRNSYQIERIKKYIFHILEDNVTEPVQVIFNCSFLKKNDAAIGLMKEFGLDTKNNVLVSIATYMGWGFMIIAIVLLILLCLLIVLSVYKQKNSLGRIVGMACLLAVGLRFLCNILTILGVIPMTEINIPFISINSSFLVVDYILLGIVLSIFRYKDIRIENGFGRKK